MQKHISTLAGIIIIVAVAVIAFGSVFAYNYLATKSQQNSQFLVSSQKTDQTLLSDVYPLFPNQKWSNPVRKTMNSGNVEVNGYETTSQIIMKDNSSTPDFFNFYDKKLKNSGWINSGIFDASGVHGDQISYKKENNHVIISNSLNQVNPNQTYPYTITYSIFAGTSANYISQQSVAAKIKLCDQIYPMAARPYFNTTEYTRRMLCFAEVAAETDDLSICDEGEYYYKGGYYTDMCYIKVAIIKNDLSICNKLKEISKCIESVKVSPEYLNKNNIFINPTKSGDVKILAPKAGEVLEKDKEYKITWAAEGFAEKDTLYLFVGEYGTGTRAYLTLDRISARQGYYNFVPNSVNALFQKIYSEYAGGDFLTSGKKYYIYLDASGDPNNDDSKLHGTSDLFEVK